MPWRRSARGLAALLWILPRPALAASRLVVQDLVDGRDDHFGGSVDCLRDRARGVAELAGDLGCGQASEHLRVVLRPGQDVVIGDVEERDGPGLVDAVDVRGHVVAVNELGVQRGLACRGRPALSASSVVRSVSPALLYCAVRNESVAVFG
jgi:hypothetical protein